MKIHGQLGKGFKEAIYKDALELELLRHKIPHERERKFKIIYEGVELKSRFIADFVVFDTIVLEIKSRAVISRSAFKQTLNYLRSSNIELGIIINFGEDSLAFQRVISSR
jgi:GxxExxY protein